MIHRILFLATCLLVVGCGSDGGSNDDTSTQAATVCETALSQAEKMFDGCPAALARGQSAGVVSFQELQECDEVPTEDVLFAYAGLLFAECNTPGADGPPGEPGPTGPSGPPGLDGTDGSDGLDGTDFPNPILFCSTVTDGLWKIDVLTGVFTLVEDGCACRTAEDQRIACEAVVPE